MMGHTCDLTLQKTDNNTKKSAAACTGRFNSNYQCKVESVGVAVNIWTKMCLVFYDLGNNLLLATHHACPIIILPDQHVLIIQLHFFQAERLSESLISVP